MGKIFSTIDIAIMAARKDKNADKLKALSNLKAKMLEFRTAKNAKPLDDTAEITIIKKMVTELREDAKIFKANGRDGLAEEVQKEALQLEIYLPEEASEEDIINALKEITNGSMEVEKKQMGAVIKMIKSKFENVDGKLVSDIVKQHLI